MKLTEFMPEMTRCDFCGRKFVPFAWNERTCYSCEQDGWPNQSKGLFDEDYLPALHAKQREMGMRKPFAKRAKMVQAGVK